ncbi:MAG: heparan-alpha-glucosaminide N-acetyltransferase [Candidatus Bipolaricaulia bacterium]
MSKDRFEEIDVVRGVAVTLMMAYHLIFDLNMVGLVNLSIGSGPLEVFADVTAGIFFTVVGISLYVSFVRTKRDEKYLVITLRKYLLRGAKIFAWGMIITLVTFLLFPNLVVLFGALQFIGVSVIIGYLAIEFTYRWRKGIRFLFLVLVLVIWVLGSGYLHGINVDHPFLIWIGMIPSGFQSLDYFPLFPWFSCVLGGLVVGDLLYPDGRRRSNLYKFSNAPTEFLGRHALIFYFAHQPIIYLGIIIFQFFFSRGLSFP